MFLTILKNRVCCPISIECAIRGSVIIDPYLPSLYRELCATIGLCICNQGEPKTHAPILKEILEPLRVEWSASIIKEVLWDAI